MIPGQDAGHGVRTAVDGEGPSDHRRIGGEAAFPEAVAQDHGVSIPWFDRPSHRDRHADDGEEVVRHAHCVQAIRLVARPPVRFGLLVATCEVVEDLGVTEKAVVRHGGMAVAADAHRRQARRSPARRLAEEELGGQAEDRGVGADAQGERDDPAAAKPGCRASARAACLRSPTRSSNQRNCHTARVSSVARREEPNSRRAGRSRHWVPCHLLQLLGAHLDMERDLLLQLTIERRRVDDVLQASQDGLQPIDPSPLMPCA